MNNNLFNDLVVVKRSGQRVGFNEAKIGLAIKYAFNDVGNKYNEKEINKVYQEVLQYIKDNYRDRKTINIEDIQDIIELILKEKKYLDVYESFYNYRTKRSESRKAFSLKKEHKFVKVIEKINSSTDFSKINPEEALLDFGKIISEEYTKSFIIDNKYLKAFEEGKIYIHDLSYFNLGYISNAHLILDKDKELSLKSITSELLNAKKEINGEINLGDIDIILNKYLINIYKQKFVNNLEKYLNLYGFNDFINIKKINDIILKQNEIPNELSILSDYFINDQVKRIITLAHSDSKKEAETELEKETFEFLNTLNENYLSNNSKYSMSLGHEKSDSGIYIINMVFNILENMDYLKNVTVIYKANKEIPSKVLELIEKCKNIKISNNNFSLNNNGNISYFSEGERVFSYDDNTSLGKMIISKTSINMARLGLKYKSLNDDFFKELDEITELVKNELLFVFEEIGDKKTDNYKVLFKRNILDDEKLEEGQKIRKVIKNSTLNINLIGLIECALVIDKENINEVIEKILKHLNNKIYDFYQETKLNFSLSAINYEEASKNFIEIDKALYGVINKITNKNTYEELSVAKNIKDLENISKYQKYLNGGNSCVINNKKLLKDVLNYDISFISFDEDSL